MRSEIHSILLLVESVDYLTAYTADGKLHSSNALAENVPPPFSIGRSGFLLQGARVSAMCCSEAPIFLCNFSNLTSAESSTFETEVPGACRTD